MFACLSSGLPTVLDTQLARLIKPINLLCLGGGLAELEPTLCRARTNLVHPEYFQPPPLAFK